jgi:hypothetical protein
VYRSFSKPPFSSAGLLHKCRYSLGSIALWTRAEQVELVNPYSGHTLTTKKHFSYYKFFLPENVDSFQLTLANCTVQIHLKVRTGRQLLGSGFVRIFSISILDPAQCQNRRFRVFEAGYWKDVRNL